VSAIEHSPVALIPPARRPRVTSAQPVPPPWGGRPRAGGLAAEHGRGGASLSLSKKRARSAGLTLVEMLVVLLIVTLLFAGVVMGTGQLASAKLRKSATTMTGLIRVTYVRATVQARSERIVFDLDHSTFWLEESEQPMLVSSQDKTGTGGAEAVTAAEKAALEESKRLVAGPQAPRPSFHAVKPGLYAASDNQGGTERSLPSGIKFRSVQTTHDEEPRTSGRAYLYFWPGGMTERASIVLRKGDSMANTDALTVLVSPLTGNVVTKAGDVSLPKPEEGKDPSEREDQGGP